MRVKRYVVDSMPDALNKIRHDLGKDAVILNTKQIRIGGFLGMFSRRMIEVIAATDQNAGRSPATAPSTVAVMEPEMQVQAGEARRAEPEIPVRPAVASTFAAQAYRNVNAAVSPAASRAAAPEPPAAEPDKQVELVMRAATEAMEAVGKRKSQSVSYPEATEQPQDNVSLREEIQELKVMVSKLASIQADSGSVNNPFSRIEERLLSREVAPHIIQGLRERAIEQAAVPLSEMNEQQAEALMREQLYHLFANTQTQGINLDTRVVHFVGPTGVGKTTTIAKLAAVQVLKHNKKVGFITSDTYRIAAIEQLKTYATILNVPLEVVFSPAELPVAFEKMKDRDMIFMDTAGRNFRNEDYVSELNELIGKDGHNETFLVLSLVSKYKDIKAISENFSRFKLDKVLWTKKDETGSCGSIVNFVNDFPIALSYITNGQNVPDDIELFQFDAFADELLGEDSYE